MGINENMWYLARIISSVRTTNPFRQLLPKEEDLPFRERIRLPVWEESPPFGKQKI